MLILQPFPRFTYVTTNFPTLPLLHLRHSSFSNPSAMTITMSSAHSPIFLSIHLHHSSFSNTSVTLPMSQLILQPFHCFIYITAHSPTLLSLLLCHRLFTYDTWRAAHASTTFIASEIYQYCIQGVRKFLLQTSTACRGD